MRLILFFCLFFPVIASAQQRFHVTVFGGLSNYQGDLQGKEFTFEQSNAAFGLGVKYDLTPHFAIRSGLVLASVEGNDKTNDPLLQFRNLSFQSNITEGNLLLEYTLADLENKRLSPYLFAGVALYHFNPYAFDSLGNKVYLKPLSTEGQGLAQYPDRKPYKLTQFAIPFGGGIKFRVNYNTVISYEIGLRKLFTDHLDDVSTRYVDRFILAQERGLKAVEMAYRADELKDGDPNYPADGTIRGGSKYKDWYYFQGITLYIGINTGKGGLFSGRKSKYGLDCPTPVY